MSGRRFGDLAGGNSGVCVGDEHLDARMPDTNNGDGGDCFGTGLATICLMSPPSGTLALTTPTTINTDTDAMCQPLKSGGSFCVLAAQTIQVDAVLRATGAKPLVLIASGAITTTQLIDVGSHRGANPELGASGDFSGCDIGTPPTTNAGGAGGSLGGLGGSGGNAPAGTGGTAGPAVVNLTLRGGCGGQDGNGSQKGGKGHGGGAVYLIAGSSIMIGGGINAAGEGGQAGATASSGGGGGGSGGLIAFEAPMVTATSLILANGGGGGEGSGLNNPGTTGQDSTTIAAATGGAGGSTAGGDGGNGGAATLGGLPGLPSATTAGGGGGGGAGFIKVFSSSANLGANVSPPPT